MSQSGFVNGHLVKMMLYNRTQNLIEVIHQIKAARKFKSYIDFIRFPFYRNIEIDTNIVFDFPLTVLIGQNGSGKSSCLHALWGAPKGKTPYNFWFDTQVDPISYYNEQRKRHSFWYSFEDDKGIRREVIKARIKRGDDPNYWETSRPLAWAGMIPKKNRDSPIEKNVLYLDFRSELSAFDKFFYFGDVKNLSSSSKQEFIRKKSSSLKKLLDEEKEYVKYRNGNANRPIRVLHAEELKWISFVLGRQYSSAKYLEHSLFRNAGYSVLFTTEHGAYSEAFAGSGEVSVVRLVLRLLDADPYSLILLDEPEVSLYPGAQERLLVFLLEQIKLKKHQVIIASHSPLLISHLPKEAIKVFYKNLSTGRFAIKADLAPEQAFYHIEYTPAAEKIIWVEDILAKEVLDAVIKKMGEETRNLFTVKFNPGGESVLKREFMTVFCREANSSNYIFFDGDQQRVNTHYDWRIFSTNDISSGFLMQKIAEQSGEKIKFSVDSGTDTEKESQRQNLYKSYLDYFHSNVFYLPKETPEELIWDLSFAEKCLDAMMIDEPSVSKALFLVRQTKCYKKKFALLTKELMGKDQSEDILQVQTMFIQRWLKLENNDFKVLVKLLNRIIDPN